MNILGGDKFSAFTVMSNWDMNEIPGLVYEHKRLLTTLLLQRKFPQTWRNVVIEKDFCYFENRLIGYISYSVRFQKKSVIRVGAHFTDNQTIKTNAEVL